MHMDAIRPAKEHDSAGRPPDDLKQTVGAFEKVVKSADPITGSNTKAAFDSVLHPLIITWRRKKSTSNWITCTQPLGHFLQLKVLYRDRNASIRGRR